MENERSDGHWILGKVENFCILMPNLSEDQFYNCSLENEGYLHLSVD